MRIFSSIAAAGVLAVAAAAATPAAAVDFVGSWDVDYYNSNSWGLNVGTSADSGSLNFGLTDTFPNDYKVVKLFDLWADEKTTETSFTDWDFNARPIEINFSFSSPVTSGSVDGQTVALLGVGSLTWNDFGLQSFNFGDQGILNVWVFNSNLGLFGQGSGNSTAVYAKFALTQMPSAVPEPGTWALMITGFGLAGAALRRQRKLAVAA